VLDACISGNPALSKHEIMEALSRVRSLGMLEAAKSILWTHFLGK